MEMITSTQPSHKQRESIVTWSLRIFFLVVTIILVIEGEIFFAIAAFFGTISIDRYTWHKAQFSVSPTVHQKE